MQIGVLPQCHTKLLLSNSLKRIRQLEIKPRLSSDSEGTRGEGTSGTVKRPLTTVLVLTSIVSVVVTSRHITICLFTAYVIKLLVRMFSVAF